MDAIPVGPPTNYCTDTNGNPVLTDQRGVPRPQGPKCDVGAFELVQTVSFATFTAKLDIVPISLGSFDLNAPFTLGAATKGINPVTQTVMFSVGPYSVTIPPGSFHELLNGAKKGSFVYAGAIGGVTLDIQIVTLGNGRYQFKAEGSPVNLLDVSNPVTVTITIGNDTGTVSVIAGL